MLWNLDKEWFQPQFHTFVPTPPLSPWDLRTAISIKTGPLKIFDEVPSPHPGFWVTFSLSGTNAVVELGTSTSPRLHKKLYWDIS